ncbi:hypothetical protein A2661_01070 [Candidatus Giovannonibacteria bacterium RIFCSPHIGHO2_01_FULL_45_24]|nr:MAG: hypothetical protein A2661_01070 [Candidatus Giovannonibacteria bacterium RIFCSPHIGHO2_01_FULL_45_24]
MTYKSKVISVKPGMNTNRQKIPIIKRAPIATAFRIRAPRYYGFYYNSTSLDLTGQELKDEKPVAVYFG